MSFLEPHVEPHVLFPQSACILHLALLLLLILALTVFAVVQDLYLVCSCPSPPVCHVYCICCSQRRRRLSQAIGLCHSLRAGAFCSSGSRAPISTHRAEPATAAVICWGHARGAVPSPAHAQCSESSSEKPTVHLIDCALLGMCNLPLGATATPSVDALCDTL